MSLRFATGSRALTGALLLAGLGAPPPVRAEVTLAVVPPFVEKAARAGTTVRDALSFTNKGSEVVVVSVDLADFRVTEHGEVHEAPPGSETTSLAPRFRISPMEVRVAPAQEVFFRYAVETPEEFEQLRAMIFLSSRPDVPPGPNRVALVARMGVPIYVENARAEPALLEVDDVRFERDPAGTDRLLVRYTARNVGRRNIRPTGFVRVTQAGGGFDATYDLNPGREPVLPGQKRTWEQSVGPVATGEVDVRLRLAVSHRRSYETDGTVAASP